MSELWWNSVKYEKEIITKAEDQGLAYIVLWDLNPLYMKQFTVNSPISGLYGEWGTWVSQLHKTHIQTQFSPPYPLCFEVRRMCFYFNSCTEVFIDDRGLMVERFWMYCKAVTDSSNLFCNHGPL